MAYTDDSQMGPRRKALVDSLAGTTGAFGGPAKALAGTLSPGGPPANAGGSIGGAAGAIGGLFGGGGGTSFHGTVQANGGGNQLAQAAMHALPNTGVSGMGPGGAPMPAIGGGEHGQVQAMFATTPEQQAAIRAGQQGVSQRSQAAFDRDSAMLKSFNGNVPSDFKTAAPEVFDPRSVLGPDAKNLAAPQAGDAGAPKADFKFGRDSVSGILNGYDHTPAGLAKAFAEHPELAGVSKIGGSKGDKILDPSSGRMIDVIQAAGDGGKAWQWLDDAGTGGGQAAGGMRPMMAQADIAPMLQGDPSAGIQAALQNINGLNDNSRLQALIAQLSGGGQ